MGTDLAIATTTATNCFSTALPLIDWWQGTFPTSTLFHVMAEVKRSFGPLSKEPIRSPKGMAYRHAFRLMEGVTVCYDNRYGHDTCAIIISGTGLPTQHLQLISRLHDLGVRATRIDVAFDDLDHALSRNKVEEAIASGKVISHFRRAQLLQDFKLHASSSSGSPAKGWGVLFGSRESDACVRMYDRGDHLRVELELKDDEAEHFADGLDAVIHDDVLALSDCYVVQACDLASPSAVDAYKRLALQTLKAKLSFRDRSAESNVSRAPLVSWWERFLEYFDPELEEAVPEAQRKTPQQFTVCVDEWMSSDCNPDLFVPPFHPIEWEELNAAQVRRHQTLGEASALLTELWQTHKHRLAAHHPDADANSESDPRPSHLGLCVSNDTPTLVSPAAQPYLTLVPRFSHRQGPAEADSDSNVCESKAFQPAFETWVRSGYRAEYFVPPYDPGPEWQALADADPERPNDWAIAEAGAPVTEFVVAIPHEPNATSTPRHLRLLRSEGSPSSVNRAPRPPLKLIPGFLKA
jgi:hypothetical protein